MKSNKILFLYFLLTIPIIANDFYLSNISPANGAIFNQNSSIPIKFDVCLGYNYQAYASEWYVNILIRNSDYQVVYEQNIKGFDVNGPACFPINNAPDFIPLGDGPYTLRIETFYTQDINLENDVSRSEFVVRSVRDLAIVSVISPQPMAEYFVGVETEYRITVRNVGDVKVNKDAYHLKISMVSTAINRNWDIYFDEKVDIEPGIEIEFVKKVSKGEANISDTDVNIPLQYSIEVFYVDDDNPSNNSIEGNFITYFPNPIWPNEFRYHDGLNKTANNLVNNDFVEFITTNKFSDPELFSLSVYDSSGNQVDSTTLDLFTVGETVDSFTVYSYEFSGDVLPDHGAISLSYDSLRFSDYFISWGGEITAVDGIWQDSTSTDIGITSTAGNSVSLSGHGTDFSSFTWENSTPTPGSFNDSQLVPVEVELTLASKYKLEQNYPNPFNPNTTINYTIPHNNTVQRGAEVGLVQLAVFDVLGRQIKTLVNEIKSPGNYEVNFDASNLTSGIYYYQLKSGDFLETRKMSLLK